MDSFNSKEDTFINKVLLLLLRYFLNNTVRSRDLIRALTTFGARAAALAKFPRTNFWSLGDFDDNHPLRWPPSITRRWTMPSSPRRLTRPFPPRSGPFCSRTTTSVRPSLSPGAIFGPWLTASSRSARSHRPFHPDPCWCLSSQT